MASIIQPFIHSSKRVSCSGLIQMPDDRNRYAHAGDFPFLALPCL
jgi:hypothetical protein